MLTSNKLSKIENILNDGIRDRLSQYNHNVFAQNFETNLFRTNKTKLFSFINYLDKSFTKSIFNPIVKEICKGTFECTSEQEIFGTTVCQETVFAINNIMEDLRCANNSPNKETEIQTIRRTSQSGKYIKITPKNVDLALQDNQGNYYLFDIKTATPNKWEADIYKRALLEWAAVILAKEPKANVYTGIAIPYNPYEPKPYSRWTMAGMLDLNNELKVAEEFWDFLGGDGAYNDLLDCFERVGIELRDEIEDYFSKYLGKRQ